MHGTISFFFFFYDRSMRGDDGGLVGVRHGTGSEDFVDVLSYLMRACYTGRPREEHMATPTEKAGSGGQRHLVAIGPTACRVQPLRRPAVAASAIRWRSE